MKQTTSNAKRNSYFSRWIVLLISFAAIGSIAFFSYQKTGDQPDAVLSNSKNGMPAELVSPNVNELTIPPEVKVSNAPAATNEDRGKVVDRLVATGKPEDALKAFKILNACINAKGYAVEAAQETDPFYKNFIDKWPKADQVCAGLSPGQLTMRLRLLIKAGEAGVKGAYEAAAQLASGELLTDTEFQEAVPRIVAAAVQAGDAEAIIGRHAAFNACTDPPKCTGRDPDKALEMLTAYRMISRTEGISLGNQDQVTPALINEIGPERAAKAIKQGEALAFASKGTK